MNEFLATLKKEGVFAKEVRSVGVAFHSYFMEALAPMLLSVLRKVMSWVSCATKAGSCGEWRCFVQHPWRRRVL